MMQKFQVLFINLINDAELPSVIYSIFTELGFNDFTIRVNNRKILNGLFEGIGQKEASVDILRIIDKIDKIGKEAVIVELQKIGISEDSITKIVDFIEIEGTSEEKLEKLKSLNIKNETFKTGIYELEYVIKNMNLFGIPAKNYKVDLTIARGLDYYTGTVYETFLDDYRELGSVCSGGRYENLAEYYTDKKMPGVGISIGLSRLFFQLIDNNIISAKDESIFDVQVIPMTNQYEVCAEVATKLREENINVQINMEEQKLGKKFKCADNLKVKYVIVIGDDEVKNNAVTLKNMFTGEQETINSEEAIDKIKKWKELRKEAK